MKLRYNETLTFVIAESSGYKGTKVATEQHDVDCIFIQSVDFFNAGFQETRDADAVVFVNPEDDFILENYYRLEGMYIVAPLFGAGDDVSWYRIESTSANRDHLLSNTTDNIECLLKKASPIPGVS